jgi:autotransporter-associated beta strand protein
VTVASGRTLEVTNGAGTTFSGQITGAGNFIKSGAGTFTITGTANNYTGTTSVTGGVLAVTNAAGNGLGTGTVAVTGGTLALAHTGSGTTAGGLVTVTNGSLRAGLSSGAAGRGVLSAGVTFGATGRYNWSLQTPTENPLAAGTDYSQLRLTGGAATLLAGAVIDLDFAAGATPTAGDPFWQAPRAWLVFDVTGTGSNSTLFTSVTDGMFAGVGSFSVSLGAGGDINLLFTPVPEPASVLACAFVVGAAGCLFRRRR